MSKHRNHTFGQRETEILTLIGQGWTNGEIAKRLHISLGTVKGHIKSIRKIVGLHESPRTLHSIIQSIFAEETKQQEDIAENEAKR